MVYGSWFTFFRKRRQKQTLHEESRVVRRWYTGAIPVSSTIIFVGSAMPSLLFFVIFCKRLGGGGAATVAGIATLVARLQGSFPGDVSTG